jgi:hypothetical protein
MRSPTQPGVQRLAVQRVAGDHRFDAFLTPALMPAGVTLTADLGTE